MVPASKPCSADVLCNCENTVEIINMYVLGPAKTYILRGIPRTYAIKTRAATDN